MTDTWYTCKKYYYAVPIAVFLSDNFLQGGRHCRSFTITKLNFSNTIFHLNISFICYFITILQIFFRGGLVILWGRDGWAGPKLCLKETLAKSVSKDALIYVLPQDPIYYFYAKTEISNAFIYSWSIGYWIQNVNCT